MNDCIFCKIVKGEIPSEIISENDNFFSIHDIKPVVNGHALVISKKHFSNLIDMPSSLGLELVECIKKTAEKVMKETNSKGFNVHVNTFRAAGQLVDHVHFHIFPRSEGDGFRACA